MPRYTCMQTIDRQYFPGAFTPALQKRSQDMRQEAESGPPAYCLATPAAIKPRAVAKFQEVRSSVAEILSTAADLLLRLAVISAVGVTGFFTAAGRK